MRFKNFLIEYLSKVIIPLISILLFPLPLIYKSITYNNKKRVLLVARNSIAAHHMLPIANLLRGISQIDLTVTVDRYPARDFLLRDASDLLKIKSLHIIPSLLCYWDLIIFTNHAYGLSLCFSPTLKKLYINHGLHVGKINTKNGQDGVYGRNKILRPFGTLGKPYYSYMFAASETEAEFAIQQTPQLQGIVSATGYLQADVFVEDAEKLREQYRYILGCGVNDKVLHIISTWGASSLFCTYWEYIEKEIDLLLEQYTLIFSLHPRFDQLTPEKGGTRNQIFEECIQKGIYVNKGPDWEGYVAAADIALSDHSSLALYHLLLNHPLLLVDVDSNQYMPESLFSYVNQVAFSASKDISISKSLKKMTKLTDRHPYTTVQQRMLSHQGKASKLYLENILQFLNLPDQNQKM